MKVIVLGGSFSPPTLAHEEIIRHCLALPGFDEVWLMPSADRLDKLMSTSWSARVAMIDLLIRERFAGDPRLKISLIEQDIDGPARFAESYDKLVAENPSIDFWFAFGGDSYRDMPNWRRGADLKNELKMLIFSDHDPKAPNVKHIQLDKKFSDMSSSQARQLIAGNQTTNDLLSTPIQGYIEQHKLYR